MGADSVCSEGGGPGRLGGQESKGDSPPNLSTLGKSLPEDQDLRRLLLLCVRVAGGPGRPCPLLCGDGGGYDRGHLVSSTPLPGFLELRVP